LLQCPHPIVRGSYINYLQPLLNPCADLSTLQTNPEERGDPYETSIDGSTLLDQSILDEEDGDEYNVTEGDDHVEIERIYHQSQWRDQETYDDIFQEGEYLDDHFNTDDTESDLSSEEIRRQ
jgi:hypothetical protein